jgi:hypothetical protein
MQKNNSKPWVLLLASMLMATLCGAQSIYFNYTDGTNTAYNLEDVRKITFDADVMNLHLWDGSLYVWNVSTIGYYKYDPNPASITEVLEQANAWQVKVYPNPTKQIVNVAFNLPAEENVSFALFDLQGKMLFETTKIQLSKGLHAQSVDLSVYPAGQYLMHLKGQNTTIIKTIIKN